MGWLKKFQSENRYVVFFFLYVGFCISYIDRSAIGLALPSISKDFALAPTQMGVVISAFFIGYSIMQLPGGWMADKFGSKSVILIALTLWSIFTFTTGHASSLAGLLFLRFVFGLCEGPYAGACYRGIAEYFRVNFVLHLPQASCLRTISAAPLLRSSSCRSSSGSDGEACSRH